MDTIIKSQIPNSPNVQLTIADIKKVNASEKNLVINFLIANGTVEGWSYENKEDWATDYNFLLNENLISNH